MGDLSAITSLMSLMSQLPQRGLDLQKTKDEMGNPTYGQVKLDTQNREDLKALNLEAKKVKALEGVKQIFKQNQEKYPPSPFLEKLAPLFGEWKGLASDTGPMSAKWLDTLGGGDPDKGEAADPTFLANQLMKIYPEEMTARSQMQAGLRGLTKLGMMRASQSEPGGGSTFTPMEAKAIMADMPKENIQNTQNDVLIKDALDQKNRDIAATTRQMILMNPNNKDWINYVRSMARP